MDIKVWLLSLYTARFQRIDSRYYLLFESDVVSLRAYSSNECSAGASLRARAGYTIRSCLSYTRGA